MDVQYDNLIYMAFVNIEQAREVVSYPIRIPIIYEKIITEAKDRIFESLRKGKTDVSDIVLEGATLYFLSYDNDTMGAYLLTLGENYPRRFANAILNDLIKLVLSSGYENDSPVLGLQSTLQEKLKDIFYKYDSVVEKDHVTLIKVKAEHAKNHIKESMFHVLESTANVELLRDTSEVLKGKAIEAFEASKNASKVYARPRNIVIIVSVVLGIAAIVAIALIIYFCTKKS